jgi:hypothetical protein
LFVMATAIARKRLSPQVLRNPITRAAVDAAR